MENGPETKYCRIAEAAQKAGVSKQTLQYYLLLGLLEPSQRSASGQQLFDEKAVDRIMLIKKMNTGYPLRDIRDIFLKKK